MKNFTANAMLIAYLAMFIVNSYFMFGHPITVLWIFGVFTSIFMSDDDINVWLSVSLSVAMIIFSYASVSFSMHTNIMMTFVMSIISMFMQVWYLFVLLIEWFARRESKETIEQVLQKFDSNKLILLVDGHFGIYVPQTFVERYGHVLDWSEEDKLILLDPDHEQYWDVWDEKLYSTFVYEGITYTLHQNEDLWGIPSDMEIPEDW